MTKYYHRYVGNLYYRHYGKERMQQILINDPNGILEVAKEKANSLKVTSLTIVVGYYSEDTNVNAYNEWHFYNWNEEAKEFVFTHKTTDKP